MLILGHLLVGEGLPGLLRGILGLIELVSSYETAYIHICSLVACSPLALQAL